MLNLYIAPKSSRAPVTEALAEALRGYLRREGIIGPFADGAFSPGPSVSRLFDIDSRDPKLPAELTFDALSLHHTPRPRFLPLANEHFEHARCAACGDELEPEDLQEALDRLRYFPVDRFELRCPSCRTDLSIRQVEFGQTVAVARFWIGVEGAATSRLQHRLVEALGRIVSHTLVIVPEVPAEDVDDWVPARRPRWRG